MTDMVAALKRKLKEILNSVKLSRISLSAGLIGNGVLKSDRIGAAMVQVDRGDFSPHSPYQDSPQGIGYGATISAPHMVVLLFY